MGKDSVNELLNISSNRYDLLNIVKGGELDKKEIESKIDSSRPTLDRAFRELEDAGILSSKGTTYELTNFGELYCQEFTRMTDVLETLTAVKDILSYLPRDAGIDRRLLEKADVHRAKEHASQEPFMEVVNIALEADEIQGYSSTLMPHYVDVFHSLIIEEETSATLVFTEDVIKTAQQNYADKFDEVVRADHATVHATQEIKTYGLLTADDTVAVPVGCQRDSLEAVIINDTESANQWATDYLDELVEHEQAYTI